MGKDIWEVMSEEREKAGGCLPMVLVPFVVGLLVAFMAGGGALCAKYSAFLQF